MDTDLQKARKLLESTGCTCVLCKGNTVAQSRQRGVLPLLAFLDSGEDYTGFCAADKVVGKATAFLYCLLTVRAVYAPVMSQAALAVLESHGIEAVCDTCVDAIKNHRQDGFCPMETATQSISDPRIALKTIRETLKRLQTQKSP